MFAFFFFFFQAEDGIRDYKVTGVQTCALPIFTDESFTYGTYPDIEGLIREQAGEMDGKKREATLHRIQQMIHERAMVAPIWELAFLNGYGPRVAESGLTLIAGHPYSAPYEDLRLRAK